MQFSLNFIDEDQDEEFCTADERHIDTVGNVFIRSIMLTFLDKKTVIAGAFVNGNASRSCVSLSLQVLFAYMNRFTSQVP